MRSPRLVRRLAALVTDRRGASAIEYGLIAALMMLGIVVAVGGFSKSLSSLWNNVSTNVDKAAG